MTEVSNHLTVPKLSERPLNLSPLMKAHKDIFPHEFDLSTLQIHQRIMIVRRDGMTFMISRSVDGYKVQVLHNNLRVDKIISINQQYMCRLGANFVGAPVTCLMLGIQSENLKVGEPIEVPSLNSGDINPKFSVTISTTGQYSYSLRQESYKGYIFVYQYETGETKESKQIGILPFGEVVMIGSGLRLPYKLISNTQEGRNYTPEIKKIQILKSKI